MKLEDVLETVWNDVGCYDIEIECSEDTLTLNGELSLNKVVELGEAVKKYLNYVEINGYCTNN